MKDNVVALGSRVEETSRSALDAVIRAGAQKMLQAAIEAEVEEYGIRPANPTLRACCWFRPYVLRVSPWFASMAGIIPSGGTARKMGFAGRLQKNALLLSIRHPEFHWIRLRHPVHSPRDLQSETQHL